ncbi:hypothetical protein TrVE_jg13651 [Triparma verrucosa]|uniref:Lon proteolytic domain-containing protein n=1 Tax=Triparma verrucosa TaxID=1606542 RepID=A0A9W7CGM0_9STRA|nr:hypothetical protein TrVE_jg13651 [Triparma verrucosa]
MLKKLSEEDEVLRDGLTSFYRTQPDLDLLKLCDWLAGFLSLSNEDLLLILEEESTKKRVEVIMLAMVKKGEEQNVRKQIRERIESRVGEGNRKYVLEQMLKEIKMELGVEVDEKQEEISKFEKALEGFKEELTEESEVYKKGVKELQKLKNMRPESQEYSTCLTYLNTLTSLPFTHPPSPPIGLLESSKILDSTHFGMKSVKSEILTILAQKTLNTSTPNKSILLTGPPGVGKTSLGSSIASSLGKKFSRISLAGTSSTSTLKGHRRTYVGSLPGKVIDAIISQDSLEGVIMLDEVDKISQTGGVENALLEILDPSQNTHFKDDYLDVPVDLSRVLFVLTSNDHSIIPPPLLDRMDVIHVSGYTLDEKVKIVNEHIIPKAREGTGIEVDIEEEAIEFIVKWYSREPGLRNLSRLIDKIYRKLTYAQVALSQNIPNPPSLPSSVTSSHLPDLIGRPLYDSTRLYSSTPHGVVAGLAWSSIGGSLLYIECKKIPGRETSALKVTGKLGEVMRESVDIAYTNALRVLEEYQSGNDFFNDSEVHLHVPEGATPKDGPSAGITMTTALVGLALDRPVRDDLAMTGEISLTGKVLKIGGLKEKVMAARRAGINCIVCPEGNRGDWEDFDDEITEGIEIHFAEDYRKVFEVAFMEEDYATSGY